MPDKPIYRLCGGTFFSLLLQARKSKRSANDHKSGYKDDFDEKSMLVALMKIVDPTFDPGTGDTVKTYTSKYKSCTSSVENFFPLDNVSVKNFSSRIKSHYSEVLSSMCSFVDKYIDMHNRSEWLVRALLEMVECDQTIPDTAEFIFGENNRQTNKQSLLSRDHFELQPFLLAVWSFIVMNRPDNKVGADTFNAWHQKDSKHSQKAFVSDIGMKLERKIVVDIIPFSTPKAVLSTQKKPAPAIKEQTLFSDSEQAQIDLHLKKSYEKYSKVKTFLYNDAPRYIYDFYVCNDISRKSLINRRIEPWELIHNATINRLLLYSNYIIISGKGGHGKSMMMRHLCLIAINEYPESNRLPIFVPLKDFNNNYSDLTDYIFSVIKGLGAIKDKKILTSFLSSGSCLLLLDGLDEISSAYRYKFQNDLNALTDKYSNNIVIMTCRPRNNFLEFQRFTVMNLCPFDHDQALKLVDKLEFRTDEPSIKEKFRSKLQNKLFRTHKEFTENPLLLTIMLITFEYYADIPAKMHIFYQQAYDALSFRHDAGKSFKRELKTGLTPERFSDYFAEFCAQTYLKEYYAFSDSEFDSFYYKLKTYNHDNTTISPSAFKSDLIDAMCLMFYEDAKYQFIHRSFQEYFCALYFSKQKDKYLERIGKSFENKKTRRDGDITFNMLYDMIPHKVEEYIFLPYLRDLFKKCDKNNGYWTFLSELYPEIFYERENAGEWGVNEPVSFTYNFICSLLKLEDLHEFSNLPHVEDFVTTEWVYVDTAYAARHNIRDRHVRLSEVYGYDEDVYGELEIVGWNYDVDMDKVLSHQDKYRELLLALDNDNFELKREYRLMRNYMQELIDKHESTSDDLFDMLTD